MEEKNDTNRSIIIAIIVIAIIAVLGYFIYASTLDNEEDAITDEIEDMVDDTDDDNEFDEVGAYTGMETYGDEQATGTIELILEEDGTATLVLAYDDTKEYTGTYTKVGNNITFTADSETTDNDNSVIDDALEDDTNDETTESSSTTFNFMIENEALYYTSEETNEDVMLDKVERNTLQYIE